MKPQEYKIIKSCNLWNDGDIVRIMKPGEIVLVTEIEKVINSIRAYTSEGYFNIKTTLGGDYAVPVSRKKGTRKTKKETKAAEEDK